jgi:carbon monoxide dehydrogenase subunit G
MGDYEKPVVRTQSLYINGTQVTASADELNKNDGQMATAAEVNNACDVSVRVQELTESGAVTAGVQSVELNHDTTAIEATIADASNHQGLFVVKATAEPAADNDHTLTLTAGTFNGTNDVATFADINDALIVYFDSDGNGTVIENVGTVALSSSS